MGIQRFFGALLFLALAATAAAQVTLVPRMTFSDGERERDMRLSQAIVQIHVVGSLAEVTTSLTFNNDSDRVLAGTLYMPLPEGSTVSGYYLDVNGRMVEGVPVSKPRARVIFEKEKRRGVDPGLVEWTQGNVFKTRVFPVPAKGKRTIRVVYVCEIVDGRMPLPVSFDRDRTTARLDVRVDAASGTPSITGMEAIFTLKKGEYTTQSLWGGGRTVTAELQLARPATEARAWLERSADGHHYAMVETLWETPILPEAAPGPRTAKRVVLVWDASLSREKADHDKELAFVEMFCKQHFQGTLVVDLVLLRHRAEPAERFEVQAGDATALLRRLRGIAYDGGSRLAAFGELTVAKPDFYLYCTDGMSTLGPDTVPAIDAPVYTFHASAEANAARLTAIARADGGRYLNLNRLSAMQALNTMAERQYTLLRVETTDGVSVVAPASAELPASGPLRLAAQLSAESGQITLVYGREGQEIHRQTVDLAATGARGEMLRKLFAQYQLQDLLLDPETNAEAIEELGRVHGIVTPGTSLLVLETLEQYLEHRVPPPQSWPEMRAKWDVAIEKQTVVVETKRKANLDRVARLWQERVKWWETEFDYKKILAERKKQREAEQQEAQREEAVEDAQERLGTQRQEGATRAEASSAFGDDDDDDAEFLSEPLSLSRPAGRVSAGAADYAEAPAPEALGGDAGAAADNAEASTQIATWDPDTPYLRALKAAGPEGQLDTYLLERRKATYAPSFFADVAVYYAGKGERDLAVQTLTNLAELELENPNYLRVLAYRLADLDELDLAAEVLQAVKEMRPEEPQSWRDLALVQARRGKHQEAIQLLYDVVCRRWDRFDEIEIIALMELNKLIPAATAAGVDIAALDLDPRLVKLLDWDLRITLSWDADDTDIDLWVIEPSGDTAKYSHNRTAIGGYVSRDFTAGYGPEEYGLRHAMPGDYVIKTHFYGSRAVDALGAVTVQAEVITNFGRPNEKRQALTLRLQKSGDQYTVGTITIAE